MTRPTHPPPSRAARRVPRRALWGSLGACAIGALLLGAPLESDASEPYQVIVNSKNPAATVDREFLTDVFLKRTTSWEHSEPTAPVDLPPSSPVRRAFSQQVLRRSVSVVRTYWTQRIFSGRDVPPPELQTEEAVLHYVASHPGAVGYVSQGSALPGTKRIEVR